MAPLVRTGGSRHTGLAALPHRNIHQKAGGNTYGTDGEKTGCDGRIKGTGSDEVG